MLEALRLPPGLHLNLYGRVGPQAGCTLRDEWPEIHCAITRNPSLTIQGILDRGGAIEPCGIGEDCISVVNDEIIRTSACVVLLRLM